VRTVGGAIIPDEERQCKGIPRYICTGPRQLGKSGAESGRSVSGRRGGFTLTDLLARHT